MVPLAAGLRNIHQRRTRTPGDASSTVTQARIMDVIMKSDTMHTEESLGPVGHQCRHRRGWGGGVDGIGECIQRRNGTSAEGSRTASWTHARFCECTLSTRSQKDRMQRHTTASSTHFNPGPQRLPSVPT
jgi:hypothetical protein